MCFVQNLVDAICVLIAKNETAFTQEILNVSDKEQLCLSDVIYLIASKAQISVRVKQLPSLIGTVSRSIFWALNCIQINSRNLFALSTASASITCDVRKTIEMGIPLKIGLSEGLEKTVNAMKVK